MVGRYPLKSAWAFKRGGSGKLALLRTEVRSPENVPDMWQAWFLGSDGIGFGILKRWTGTEWLANNKMKVHYF